MKFALRFGVVLAILAVALGGAKYLISTRSKAAVAPRVDQRPVARVVELDRGNLPILIEATGTVMPKGQLTVTAEVQGRIIEVNPDADPGNIIAADSILIRIDDTDYHAAVAKAKAIVANSTIKVAQETALCHQAKLDWDILGEGDGSPLTLRTLQLEAAQAQFASDKAALNQAQRDLQRCAVTLPHALAIEDRLVERGQFVSRGQILLHVRNPDILEVHLPITIHDLSALQIPVHFNGEQGPQATLTTTDGREATGQAVRITGSIDAKTQLVTLVLRVAGDSGLLPGDFVRAQLTAQQTVAGIRIPRHLLRRDGSLFLVNDQGILVQHPTSIIRINGNDTIIADDVPPGLRLVTNRLEGWSAGTDVRVVTPTTQVESTSPTTEPVDATQPTATAPSP